MATFFPDRFDCKQSSLRGASNQAPSFTTTTKPVPLCSELFVKEWYCQHQFYMYTIIAGINVIYIYMYTQIFVCIYLCKCENMCICKYVHLCIYTYICTHVNNDDPKGNVAMKLLLKVLVMTASFSNQGVSVCFFILQGPFYLRKVKIPRYLDDR